MLKTTRFFAILSVATAVFACSEPEPVNSEWHNLPTEGWRYGNTRTFNAEKDTFPADTILLSVRHTAAYPYANLWLEVKYETADTVRADTVDIRLADEFGQWNGTGSSLSFQLSDTILPSASIRPGSPVSIRHIMRLDTLREIQQLGIEFK